jgi:hypothetical protein
LQTKINYNQPSVNTVLFTIALLWSWIYISKFTISLSTRTHNSLPHICDSERYTFPIISFHYLYYFYLCLHLTFILKIWQKVQQLYKQCVLQSFLHLFLWQRFALVPDCPKCWT